MKKIYFLLSIICCFSIVQAQNVNYTIYATRFYTGHGNTDFWTSDDPRWLAFFYDNTDGYVSSGSGVLRSIDDGLDGPAWDDPADFLVKTVNQYSCRQHQTTAGIVGRRWQW